MQLNSVHFLNDFFKLQFIRFGFCTEKLMTLFCNKHCVYVNKIDLNIFEIFIALNFSKL